MAFNSFTSNSVGTGNFTFNEDVSHFLRLNDQFIAVIDYDKEVTWPGDDGTGEENERIDTEFETVECTYLGNGVFSRNVVDQSSSNDQFVDFSPGLKTIDVEISTEKDIRNEQSVLISNSNIFIANSSVTTANTDIGTTSWNTAGMIVSNATHQAAFNQEYIGIWGPSGATIDFGGWITITDPVSNTTLSRLDADRNRVSVGNSTLNAVMNSTTLAVGNSTVNIVANSISLTIANSTSNAVVNTLAITVGNSTHNTKHYGPGIIVTHAALFDPGANDNAAFQTTSASYGGGIVLNDGGKRGGVWTTDSGNTLVFGAGGLVTGFPSGSGGDVRIQGQGGMCVGGPSGGFKGVGALNAVNVYDDNVLLTCMALSEEFLTTGKINVEEWDKKAPKLHETARLFNNMLEAGFDPRDPKQYREKLKTDHALPGMPTEAEWVHNDISTGQMINRLWLAMEMLALTVIDLQKKLEEKTDG